MRYRKFRFLFKAKPDFQKRYCEERQSVLVSATVLVDFTCERWTSRGEGINPCTLSSGSHKMCSRLLWKESCRGGVIAPHMIRVLSIFSALASPCPTFAMLSSAFLLQEGKFATVSIHIRTGDNRNYHPEWYQTLPQVLCLVYSCFLIL